MKENRKYICLYVLRPISWFRVYTPRSKHYHIKTVWFREEIVKRGIKLLKIDTVEQLGDIFTKGLGKATFEYLRKKLMGW